MVNLQKSLSKPPIVHFMKTSRISRFSGVLFRRSARNNILVTNLNWFCSPSQGICLLKFPKYSSGTMIKLDYKPFLWCNVINLTVLFTTLFVCLFACPLCKEKRESFSQKRENTFRPFSSYSFLISIWSIFVEHNVMAFVSQGNNR